MSQDSGGIGLVRDIIYIAQADWDETVASARVKLDDEKKDADGNVIAEATKPKEKAMFGMVRRWATMMVGLDGNEATDGGLLGAGKAATRDGLGNTGVAKGARDGAHEGKDGMLKRKFKLSSVVGQRDDQEVEALSPEAVRETIKRFRAANDNLPPAEDEEAKADQTQGIKLKLAHDVVPYADFGVLRPFGQRLERALKFHAKFWDVVSGDFVMKELPGPASHAEWLRSWKVQSFIMVALGGDQDEVGAIRFQGGVACVEKYGNTRGNNSGWIVALADQRMRSERMEIIRRSLEAAYTEGRFGDAGGF